MGRCHNSVGRRLSSGRGYVLKPRETCGKGRIMRKRLLAAVALWSGIVFCAAPSGHAQNAPAADSGESAFVPEDWSLHAQSTFIEQGNLRFHSPYRGTNSLDPAP